jgi:glycosyltransferase involved in cell wall biosynthesis
LSYSAAVFSARLAGKTKIIYVVNNIAFPIKSFQRGLLYPIDLFVSKNVSKFITASERAKKSLEKVLSLKNEKVLQIPNTIVPRKINTQKEMFRKKYGINKDDILIGCVALFIERKGHVYLINAFSEFLKHYNGKNNVYLILDGNGDKKDEIKKLINELKLNKNIILTELANIYDLYNAMDFLVLASIEKEDFPNVIIESMYMGKPVIGTDVGGIPEQIKDGYNGEIVKPRNTKELGNAILKLVNDKKYSKKLGKNGKKLFEDKFSENTIVGRYIKLYNVLVNERNKK